MIFPLEAIRTAAAAQDWAGGLALALDAWQASRAPALADLVDALSARMTVPRVPRLRKLHVWWMETARIYEPVAVTALLAHIGNRASLSEPPWAEVRARHPEEKWLDWIEQAHPQLATSQLGHAYCNPHDHRNRLDRLAALAAWPPDPRTAHVLADWLVHAPVCWAVPAATTCFYAWLADLLIELGDARVRARLATCVAEPRGETEVLREIQRTQAARALAALDADAAPPALPAETTAALAQLLEELVPEPVPAERAARLDRLWRAVAEQPDDDGPRLVLADALLELHDPRGDFIALQCAPEPADPRHAVRATRMIAGHWDEWLGDLAVILLRKGTEFRRGMLDTVRVGMQSTPPWAYDRLAGHRELGAVRTARLHHISPRHYATFLAALPNLRHAELYYDVLVELEALDEQLTAETVEYRFSRPFTPEPPSVRPRMPRQLAELIAATLPALTELELGSIELGASRRDLYELLELLPQLLPGLRQIRIMGARLLRYPQHEGEPWDGEAELARFAALPLVILDL